MCCQIIKSAAYKNAEVIAGYIPLKWEVDIMSVLEHALAQGKTLVLPRCDHSPHMTMHRIKSLDELSRGKYGIPEPPLQAPVVMQSEIDLILVPLEGIDDDGYRIGKGGGYYDAYLKDKSLLSMGCALSWQHVDRIPREPWDVALNMAADMNGIHMYQLTQK